MEKEEKQITRRTNAAELLTTASLEPSARPEKHLASAKLTVKTEARFFERPCFRNGITTDGFRVAAIRHEFATKRRYCIGVHVYVIAACMDSVLFRHEVDIKTSSDYCMRT